MNAQNTAPETKKQRVIIDTDTGLDDAHAILYLLAQQDVEVIGITTVFGNCYVEDSAKNVATVLKAAGQPHIPIYGGAGEPLQGEASIGWYVHGRDGLGDRGLERVEPQLQEESGAEYLVRIANEHPDEVDLLALGPLTNLGLALQQDPQLLTKFRSVVVMGGAGPYPAPGEAVLVDANTANDRTAAELVFTLPNAGKLTMVGVNVTNRAILDEDALAQLRALPGPVPQLSAELLDAYNDFYQSKWGRRVSAAHDGLAAVILHRPDVVTATMTGPVDFHRLSEGLATRVALTADGQPVTSGTPEGAQIRAVTGFNFAEFRQLFLAALCV